MNAGTFHNFSKVIHASTIGFGWLKCITMQKNNVAVTTDWHAHSTIEMLMCLRGETRYEFRSHPPALLKAGTFLVIPRGTAHRVLDTIDAPGFRIGMHMTQTDCQGQKFAIFSHKEYIRIRRHLEAEALRTHVCSIEMRRHLKQLARTVDTGPLSSLDQAYLRILCSAILCEATRHIAPQQEPRMEIVDAAVNWIESHYFENVSLERLIAFIGYSRTHFFTLFREHTGMTPNAYLRQVRLRKAKDMINTSYDSIAKIATACGFTDSVYFCRVFKIQTGMSPTEFRRKFRTSQ
jgi:AraC-like DNA-binding protein